MAPVALLHLDGAMAIIYVKDWITEYNSSYTLLAKSVTLVLSWTATILCIGLIAVSAYHSLITI